MAASTRSALVSRGARSSSTGEPVLPPGTRPTALWWRALAELEVRRPRAVSGLGAGWRAQRRRIGTNLYRRVQQLEAA